MSSINYLDNSYLRGKTIFDRSLLGKQNQVQTIYFHDFGQGLRTSTKRKFASYYPFKIFLAPAVLTVIGSILIYVSLISPLSTVAAQSRQTISTTAPKLADTSVSAKVSAVTSTVEIKATAVKTEQSVLTNTADISSLHLSSANQWPIHGSLTTYYSSYHQGIDIANTYGTAVRPFMEGVVTSVNRLNWGFGNYITVRHEGGFESLYAHLSTINVVVGQKVGLDTTVGHVGSTGYSTGPHLHLEIYHNGPAINPLSVLH